MLRFGLFLSILAVAFTTMGAVALSAAAEPVGLFLSGEKSAEEAKQPKFGAEKYVATIGGASTSTNTYKLQYGNAECNGVLPTGKLSAASSQLGLQWTYGLPCVFAGFGSPIMQNGCEIVLHVSNAGPPYVGSTDIVCPAGKGIVFTASAAGVTKCTATIFGQTGLEGISFENLGTGSGRSIEATLNLSGIKYTQVAGTGLGKCTAGEFENGTYTGTVKFTASK
jgi:Na+-transporting methylmalonyl-CoA/oxaloacetate decarboxylase gamma subunit